ncbi:unnamed protein product [Callosobruchus maculatus]|uniref:Uncharacterized protein n=1 Tax=Callosobruchus maculatus TaxID=64391 RepID=A0A653BR74_CALMS|nr:unnamed protein product [Callosobruchus maculatus]
MIIYYYLSFPATIVSIIVGITPIGMRSLATKIVSEMI